MDDRGKGKLNGGYQHAQFERCRFEFDSSRENANIKVFAPTEWVFFNRGYQYQRVKFERCCFEFDSSRENANVKVFATTEVFCGVFF